MRDDGALKVVTQTSDSTRFIPPVEKGLLEITPVKGGQLVTNAMTRNAQSPSSQGNRSSGKSE